MEKLSNDKLVAFGTVTVTMIVLYIRSTQEAKVRKKGFTWSKENEPHSARRVEILKKYPEIKKLYGHEPLTKYMITTLVALQLWISIQMLDASWRVFTFVAYTVGGTVNHALFLAIHELSHNLGFKKAFHNKLFGFWANVPIPIPYSTSFKPFHMDHHRAQGVEGVDVDIPLACEAKIVGNSTVLKFIWLFFQIFAYALRPVLVKGLDVSMMLICHWVFQLSVDCAIYHFFGSKCIFYFLLSTFFAGSIHPTSGHFVGEHLTRVEDYETYSYYGPLNHLCFNVGYHNEHHDFPFVAWSNLPKVRKIAPEFYDKLPECQSWVGQIWWYIFNPEASAFSRVLRKKNQVRQGRR